MPPVIHAFSPTAARAAVAVLALSLSACSTLDNDDDTINYRAGARKTAALDVPPDLSALVSDGRYQVQAGTVSASTLGQRSSAAQPMTTATSSIAPNQQGDLRIERQGQDRWLASGRSPEALWPQLREFWLGQGFGLEVEDATAGLLQTSWAENRANLPQDLIRRTLGSMLDKLYDTGERDQYRMRIERTAQGSEIYITHRGLQEVYTEGNPQEGSTWTFRPSDRNLEVQMLARLMVSLNGGSSGGTSLQTAVQQASAASQPAAAARARAVQGTPAATMQLDDPLERAWRRVGLALDRSGFTVEERDRAQGLYAVRYIDPAEAGKEGPGFWARLFGAEAPKSGPERYRILVKQDGAAGSTLISVLTQQGQPDNGSNAQRIIRLLVEELRY